jgi:hypothetical protein
MVIADISPQSSVDEDLGILGYVAVSTGKYLMAFQNSLWPSSS